jgi:hypothetical protein
MGKPQLRASQVITTYGPGAMVDLPDDAVLIAGLETWRYHRSKPIPTISEPRLISKLESLLGVTDLSLRKPPPAVEEKGFTPDVGAFYFPEWVISQRQVLTPQKHRARRLVNRKDLEKGRFLEDDGKRYSVVPVRFVRACLRGHIGDVDWRAFVHGQDNPCGRDMFFEERGTTGDLDSIWVRCSCGLERSMSQAARMDLQALGRCNGARPWLGPGTREACGQPNRLLIRSASNAYFPQLLSVISIPDSQEAVDEVVKTLWDSHLSAVESEADLAFVMKMPTVKRQLEDFEAHQIMGAIERLRGATADDRPVKEVEFEALAEAKEQVGSDVPEGDFFARALPKSHWDAPWMSAIQRVVLVHRLREVVAQVGFTRFEAAGPDIQGELDITVERAPLALDVVWLPAVENRGEGIFLQFKPEAIQAWLDRDQVKRRDGQLQRGFDLWKREHEGSNRKYFGLPFYMLHSLSHLLLTAISLECGYPPSSLRERVYAWEPTGQYGILIYTGSPDAEGTLGGLVEAGKHIRSHMQRALESGRLCSNDPVCAFHAPAQHDHQPLLGSACHGCLLISETSCEQHNDFLDRALVVPTVEMVGAEFFQ